MALGRLCLSDEWLRLRLTLSIPTRPCSKMVGAERRLELWISVNIGVGGERDREGGEYLPRQSWETVTEGCEGWMLIVGDLSLLRDLDRVPAE